MIVHNHPNHLLFHLPLASIPEISGHFGIIILRFAVLVMLFFSIPIQVQPCRDSLRNLIYEATFKLNQRGYLDISQDSTFIKVITPNSNFWGTSLTLLILGICWAFGSFTERFDEVICLFLYLSFFSLRPLLLLLLSLLQIT